VLTTSTSPFSRRQAQRLAVLLPLILALGTSAHVAPAALEPIRPPTAPAGEADADPAGPGVEAQASAADVAAADELMANRYRFAFHPVVVTLPADLRWDENPLNDRNWQFQFHTLRWASRLSAAYEVTGERRYLDRYQTVLRSWFEKNPRANPPSPWSWNDHSTAWRALVFADAVRHLGRPAWLVEALRLHGRTLADPSFYVRNGNHALNQDIGLLGVACVLDERPWAELARSRMSTLILDSIDVQGVTNEQSVDYHLYNYLRYVAAGDALQDCGMSLPGGFERVATMPDFLAYATLPNGEYELIGDTEVSPAREIPGTIADFAASAGQRGLRPPAVSVVYEAGFAFGRSGWGDARPFADEVFYSLRFGPRRHLHGHLDHEAVTLYGFGRRLLLDRGKYAYENDAFRRYVVSREAHNVVTVDGLAFDPRTETALSSRRSNQERDALVVRHSGYPGVTSQRRVVFARADDLLVVHDRLRADRPLTFRQLWQLPEGSSPAASGGRVVTRLGRGNVAIHQLAGEVRHQVVAGRRDPMQGWQSYHYNQIIPAPTVEAVQTGRAVDYLTLLVPASGTPRVRVLRASVAENGFAVLVETDAGRRGLRADGPEAMVRVVRSPFLDTWTTAFHDDIEELHARAVLRGVAEDRYAPGQPVTRGQMATFLVQLADAWRLDLPQRTDVAFDDIAASPHAQNIERLAAAGVTRGVGDGRSYAPGAPLRRDQMATFLSAFLRSVGRPLPPTRRQPFVDVGGNVHRTAIEELAAAGLAHGVGDDRFAPGRTLNRGQMAAFLARAGRQL
jgi:hypothetical protein